MSLVLNGGESGTGATQYAYVDSRIVTTLPITISYWFKAGNTTSASGDYVGLVDKDATLGTYRMGNGVERSTGPIMAQTATSRVTTASQYTMAVPDASMVTISEIITGSVTECVVDDPTPFSVGQFVRVTGTLTGITGIASGRDYRVESITGYSLFLTIASSGTWTETNSGNVRPSAYQPERWNLAVAVFLEDRFTFRAGVLGNTTMLIDASLNGITGQDPVDIWSVIDRFCVGAYAQSGSAARYANGELAHVGLWDNTNPTLAQADELLTVAPNLVTWGAPTAYYPFLADANDSIGSNHMTLVDTPTINGDGPSITVSGGGGGGGYLPIMRPYNPSIFGVR